jgi:hypothetical protein
MERSLGWSTVDHDHGRPRDLPQHELNGTTLLENSPRGRLEEAGSTWILSAASSGWRGDGVRPAMVLNDGGE